MSGLAGFALYVLALAGAAMLLPAMAFDPASQHFIFIVGGLAVWRYSWGALHFVRSLIYRNWRFPRLRALASKNTEALMPPQAFFLVTSYRIEAMTAAAVYRAAIAEAINCGVQATIVASLVEPAEEFMVKDLFRRAQPPAHVNLSIVRIPGTGKRDALAQGLRAISRSMPLPGAVIAVIDGDSIVPRGLVRKCAPFFRLRPEIGALTTDEDCDVRGSRVIREWHDVRFAQRQILMSSMALSGKVLTLTGRMSMFRVSVATHPDFIRQIEDDSIDHWRLGRFRFLTGDDKSTWHWLLKNGYGMLYVPDVVVRTVEHPPAGNFFQVSSLLMLRWFGNMLRTNGRALQLGPRRTGFFIWWCLLDQRLSMWTALSGPVFALLLATQALALIPIYAVWVGATRGIMAMLLLSARPRISWRYPFLIYYNQIWGSLIKTYVLFRLDRQAWTRQKTRLRRGLEPAQQRLVATTSMALHAAALLCFVAAVGLLAGVFTLPI